MSESESLNRLSLIEREDADFRVALHLLEIEHNSLDEDTVAMFDMFHRKGLLNEQCLQYIRETALGKDRHDIADAAE